MRNQSGEPVSGETPRGRAKKQRDPELLPTPCCRWRSHADGLALASVLARALVTGALVARALVMSLMLLQLHGGSLSSGSQTSSPALRRVQRPQSRMGRPRPTPSSVRPGEADPYLSPPRSRRPCFERARTRGRWSGSRTRRARMRGRRTSCCRRRAWASSGCSRSVCCLSGSRDL